MSGIQEKPMLESVPNAIVLTGIELKRLIKKNYDIEYRIKNKEKIRIYNAKWRKENPEKSKVATVNWRKSNPEKEKAYYAKYYKANSVKEKAESAKWYKSNPEKAKAKKAKWYKANPERVKVYSAKWQKANPEKVKASIHKRRAQKLAAGGSFTAGDIKKMLKQQKGKCIVCKIDITNSYHIDHVIPFALGGNNGIQNIQLLCPHCNCSKNAKHPIDFMQERGFLL